MKRSKARELTGDVVQAIWDQAFALVNAGDYSAARLVIEQSLVSESVALEKVIAKREQERGASAAGASGK